MKEEKQQLWIILIIVFIGFAGASIAYPIFPPLFLHPENSSLIPQHWGESDRSIFLGMALAAYPLGQFIGAPILCSCLIAFIAVGVFARFKKIGYMKNGQRARGDE